MLAKKSPNCMSDSGNSCERMNAKSISVGFCAVLVWQFFKGILPNVTEATNEVLWTLLASPGVGV